MFLDTQGVVEEVVLQHREEQRAQGINIGEHNAWMVEEIALTAEALLKPVCHILCRLHDVGLRLRHHL